MNQRIPRGWEDPKRAGHLPRLLVEADDPVLAISDFSAFQEAGFSVAVCGGPGAQHDRCPLLRGEPCALVAGADVVLHRLDPATGIAEAIGRQHPGVPVVRITDGTSVPGQIRRLLSAVAG